MPNTIVRCVFAIALLLIPAVARADDVFEQAGKAADEAVKKGKKEAKKTKKKLDKAGKETKEDADEVAGDVADSAKDVAKDTKKAADEVGKKTTKAADEVVTTTKKWGSKGGHVVLKGQKELEKYFSKETLEALAAALQKRVDDAQRTPMWEGMVAKIDETRPAAQAELQKSKELALKVKTETEKYKATVDASFGLVKEITTDPDDKKKLERLLVLCAMGTFTEETERLGQWFAKLITTKLAPAGRTIGAIGQPPKAGVASAKAQNGSPAPNYPAKSFSLTLGWNFVGVTGAVVAGGFEGRFGVAGDLFWEKDRYDVRAIYTIAEQLGAGIAATEAGFDLAVNLMLTVSPMPTSNASGVFFGLSGEAGAGVGFEFELEWGFANGSFVFVPALSAAIGYQDPIPGGAVLGNLGYAVTLGRDGWDHGLPGVPTK